MDPVDITPIITEVAKQYHYTKPIGALVFLQEHVLLALRWLHDFFENFHIFTPGTADTHAAATVMQALLLTAGIGCVALLACFMWKRMGQLSSQSQLAKRGAAAFSKVLDSAGWQAEANAAAAQEEWKQACRSMYFALLLKLQEHEILTFSPTRTNYECWYALASKKRLARLFREMAEVVELVWFGNQLAEKSDYERCCALFDQARNEIEAPSPVVSP